MSKDSIADYGKLGQAGQSIKMQVLECPSGSRVVGRVCPPDGAAGTKTERGHSCPQPRRTDVKLSNVPILLSIRDLLRTRMSALRAMETGLDQGRASIRRTGSNSVFGFSRLATASTFSVPAACGPGHHWAHHVWS